MDKIKFDAFVMSLTKELNDYVFPRILEKLQANPGMRETLNPAFPFPAKVRIGLLDTHLVVEYVGPEQPDKDTFEIEGAWRPGVTVFDFLGIELTHLTCPRISIGPSLENFQVFLGDATLILGDYMYDILANPKDLIINGIPDFTLGSGHNLVSNVTFFWSEPNGAFRTRHIDFLELIPIQEEGWAYQTEESLKRFADFLSEYKVPKYKIELHRVLNEFIELVSKKGVDEPTITTYLSIHSEILQLAFGAQALNPQTLLIWKTHTAKPNLQPDFLPTKMDGYADILEFKLPRLKGKPVVGAATRSMPSHEIDSALAQIDEYADWCSQDVHRQWLEAEKGIKVHTPHTTLVIGHSDDFSAEDRQKFRGRRNVTVFTYDEFIQLARMQLYSVR